MDKDYRNYYKICREGAGLTQEKAAEILGTSVRSLSAYENWETAVSEEIVRKMVRLYKSKSLGCWHLRNTSELGKECIPEICEPQSNADLYMNADISERNALALNFVLKKLLSDGQLTLNEIPEYDSEVRETAKKLAGAYMAIYTYDPMISK